MKTFMAKAEDVSRKWYIIDAAGKSVGRVASQAASILRGKNKPEFTPHVDTGDYVIIINADKAVFTGKKLQQKVYKSFSGYIGGLKETSAKVVMENRADYALYHAVHGMLPKNKLGAKMIKKLRVYKGAEHEQQAQKPELL